MKKLIALVSFLYVAAALGVPAGAAPLPPAVSTGGVTLQDCYQRALRVSETLTISEESIRQLEIQYRQGVSAVLPSLSWIRTQQYQDTPDAAPSTSTNSVQGTLTRSARPESYFEIYQPIFHGMREFNALKGFASARLSSEKNRDQARLALLGDVAQVFYTSLDLQQELELLANQHNITEDRIKQLHRWVDLGRSRSSEVLSTQVDLISLEALVEQTRAALQTARLTLEFLTQIPPQTPLVDDRPDPAPAALEQVLLQSTLRPDLQALAEDRKTAQYRLKYAQGDYWPSLDFTGKWYTERVGFQEDSKWDALFSLEVPIFQGGGTRAAVQLARSQVIIADLAYARQQRLVQRDVKNAHQTLNQAVLQANLYDKAAGLARQNYDVQQKEYRLGLITNLDVLQVLKTLIDLEIQRLRTRANAKLNDVNLRILTGTGL